MITATYGVSAGYPKASGGSGYHEETFQFGHVYAARSPFYLCECRDCTIIEACISADTRT